MTEISIRQELVLKATRQAVWDALTTPEGWTGWFRNRVEGEFHVGHTLALDFGEQGKCWGVVVERDELNAFAYKWHPGEDCVIDKYPESEMTTVRFSLSDHAEGTLLTMVERGFENVPETRRDKCVELNTGGWKYELEELRVFVEEGKRHALAGTKTGCGN